MVKKHLVIVIPCYNEEKHLTNLVKKLNLLKEKWIQTVFVDDGSTDGTAEIIKNTKHHLIQHCINLGKGAALKTGCEFAFSALNATNVITMDGDGQHSVMDLHLFFQKISKSDDIILGVRDQLKIPRSRLLTSRFISKIIEFFYRTYIPDILSGYKAFSKNAYELIKWEASGYEVEIEIGIKIAKKQLPFDIINITTSYHNYPRGVTFLDAIKVGLKLLGIK